MSEPQPLGLGKLRETLILDKLVYLDDKRSLRPLNGDLLPHTQIPKVYSECAM